MSESESMARGIDEEPLTDPETVRLTGIQALARLPLDIIRFERSEGWRTAAFISGYEGSPLGGYDPELGRHKSLSTITTSSSSQASTTGPATRARSAPPRRQPGAIRPPHTPRGPYGTQPLGRPRRTDRLYRTHQVTTVHAAHPATDRPTHVCRPTAVHPCRDHIFTTRTMWGPPWCRS
ncbi:hypothetical protein GCM10022232_83470 [Streptomyces plumbiresistens]|uniref:Uncharacterized protein n=1 Tax=Streptomyces plumbiresistens TaxID=511811 RepID=A0ABP7TET1_9ACTN